MQRFEHASVFLVVFLGCTTLIVFGVILGYERAFLAIQSGETEILDSVATRIADPFSFWTSVIMHGLIGAGLIALGAYGFWRAFRSSPHPPVEDDLD